MVRFRKTCHGLARKGPRRGERRKSGHGGRRKDTRAARCGGHVAGRPRGTRVRERQTISSWENGKTYPDVQSLLLLSEIFDASVDSLIKGDVETMNETIDRDIETMRRLSYVMVGFLLLMIAAMIWVCLQAFVWDWPLEQTVPTFVLALVLWGVAMFAACWVDRIKKSHDLVTYGEILATGRARRWTATRSAGGASA